MRPVARRPRRPLACGWLETLEDSAAAPQNGPATGCCRLGNTDRWCEGPRRVHFPGHPRLRVTEASAGHKHSLVVDAAGQAWAFGSNKFGELGTGAAGLGTPVPQRIAGALQGQLAWKVAAGAQHSLLLTSRGQVFSWGSNAEGQLGLGAAAAGPGTVVATPTPVPIPAGLRIVDVSRAPDAHAKGAARRLASCSPVQIACGAKSSGAVAESGEVFLWGLNVKGALGLGYQETKDLSTLPAPTRSPHLSRPVSISLGTAHGAAYLAG